MIDLVTTLSTQLASSLRDTNVEQSQHTQIFFPTKHQHATLRVEEEACTGKRRFKFVQVESKRLHSKQSSVDLYSSSR
jgi:hypothetical protein